MLRRDNWWRVARPPMEPVVEERHRDVFFLRTRDRSGFCSVMKMQHRRITAAYSARAKKHRLMQIS